MDRNSIRIEPVAGTRTETYRYTGPEGAFEAELGVDRMGEHPIRRAGQIVRVVDELGLARAEGPFPYRVPAAVRTSVARRLAAHFSSLGMPCDVRLPSGALRDVTGSVRPGYRLAGAAVVHSDGWGIIDFYRAGSYRGTSPVPSLRPGRWLAPTPYPRTIEYRAGQRRARIERRIELREATSAGPGPASGTHVSVLYPASLRWIEGDGSPLSAAERAIVADRIVSLGRAVARGYELREGPAPPDPDAVAPLDEEYELYPYPTATLQGAEPAGGSGTAAGTT